jgi:hypothetical protein
VIERHLKPALGHIRLQQLKPTDSKRYYNESSLSPMQGLVQRNVASLVIGKPHRPERREDMLMHCWEAEEARRFITAETWQEKRGRHLTAPFSHP